MKDLHADVFPTKLNKNFYSTELEVRVEETNSKTI